MTASYVGDLYIHTVDCSNMERKIDISGNEALCRQPTIHENTESRISVIIPVYNVAQYIDKCLITVTRQTFSNLEIIIVNDGSTDNSLAIAMKFAENDTRIRVVSKENGGVASARNYGIDLATGKYIGFVDPDDYIDARMYEKLYGLLTGHNADIAVCHQRGCISRHYIEPERSDIITRTFNHIETLQTFMSPEYSFNGLNATVYNKLYKRELFAYLRFDEDMRRGEDTEFFHKVVFKSNKLIFTDERLYFYYKRQDGLTGTILDLESAFKVDTKLLALFEYKIQKIQNNIIYENSGLKQEYVNSLLSFNIELAQKYSGKSAQKLLFTFRGNYKKYFLFVVTKFSYIRNMRLFLFYISPHIYQLFIRPSKSL